MSADWLFAIKVVAVFMLVSALLGSALYWVISQPGPNDVGHANGQSIERWHDDEKSVTCWLSWGYQKGGIACLPDSVLAR